MANPLDLAPGAPAPTWLAPALRLAAWTVALHGDRSVRRDIPTAMYNAARVLNRYARAAAVRGLYEVGQLPTAPTPAEGERASERAWDRIRAGGARALDAAQRAAATLEQNAERLYERWREARATEARVIDELRRGMGDLSMTIARAPRAAASFLSGGGLVLVALVGLLMMGGSRN